MINNLFKLYLRNTSKTPLEDFTTEAFAGILKYDPIIKNEFIRVFLKIPQGEYQIKTQVKYDLENDMNCIVDLVFENEDIICFIENKVNSKEGYRQLERYSKVLDIYNLENKKTYLRYCTKYYDNKILKEHEFKQYRWFQIAKFLKPYSKNALVNDFLHFLKIKNMSQDLTITTKDLFAIENLFDTVNVLNGYLERIKPRFIQTFKSTSNISDGCTVNQLIKHKRLIYYFKDIVGTYYSEIKYGFLTSSSQIYVGIWIDKSNSEYKTFKSFFYSNNYGFLIIHLDSGMAIELKEPLQNFINNDNADNEISNWFQSSFSKFVDLIKQMNNVSWKIGV